MENITDQKQIIIILFTNCLMFVFMMMMLYSLVDWKWGLERITRVIGGSEREGFVFSIFFNIIHPNQKLKEIILCSWCVLAHNLHLDSSHSTREFMRKSENGYLFIIISVSQHSHIKLLDQI